MPRLIALLCILASPTRADDLNDVLRTRLLTTLLPAADCICPACDGTGCASCGDDGRVEAKAEGEGRKADEIAWLPYADALASGKPLLIHVTDSVGCRWCDRAYAALSTPEVIAESENFACVLVDQAQADYAQYRRFADHYGIDGVPTTLFLSPRLERWGRKTGYYHDYPLLLRHVTAKHAPVRSIVVLREVTDSANVLRKPESDNTSRAVCGPNGCYLVP